LRESDRIGNGSKTGVPKAFLDFQERIKDILEIDGALKVTDLDISGNDLIRELNLKPSPMIGEILNYLLEIVLDDPELNTNPTLIDKAKEYYNKKKEFALENYKDSPENLGKF